MSAETATYINSLDASLPAGNQKATFGDDHLRVIKGALKRTFPNVAGEVTLSHTQINDLDTRATALEGNRLQYKYTAEDGNYVDFQDYKALNVAYPDGLDPSQAPTIKWVQDCINLFLSNQLLPPGSLWISLKPENPATYLGFGTWVRYAEGYTLASAGTGVDSRGEPFEFPVNAVVGEYRHQLTASELPYHTHDYLRPPGNQVVANGAGEAASDQGTQTSQTSGVGGNAPHNNVQPTIGVYVWYRQA